MASSEQDAPLPDTPEESEREQQPSEMEILNKQIQESKDEQIKMMQTINDLIKTIEKIKGNKSDKDEPAPLEGSMYKLEGFNKKDMIKPPPYNMEPDTFLNWAELFTTYMMSIDPQWENILKELQKVDASMSRNALDKLQDELKMTPAVKKQPTTHCTSTCWGIRQEKRRAA